MSSKARSAPVRGVFSDHAGDSEITIAQKVRNAPGSMRSRPHAKTASSPYRRVLRPRAFALGFVAVR